MKTRMPGHARQHDPAQRRHAGVRLSAAGILAALVALLAVSCSPPTPDAGEQEPEGIEKVYERGPVTLRVTIDRKEISIAERVNLTLAVEARESYEVALPKFGEKLEQFGIVDYRTPQPKLVDKDTVLHSKLYTLEPFLSGEYTIPPMTVHFWQKETEKENAHELETEALTVTVKSLLPEQLEDLQIRDIAPPAELPPPPVQWLWLGAAAATLVCVGIGTWLWRRGRRHGDTARTVRIPAHERAFATLQQIVDEDLVGKGQVKLFYTRVSDVLRHYLEDRFELHAPEQTTEEFLAAFRESPLLTSDAVLQASHQALLRNFLTHCDLVKFAEHQPGTDEIQKTFDCCKTFIVETQEDPKHAL